jgi:hypothetical protein
VTLTATCNNRWSTRATDYAFHFYANTPAGDEDKGGDKGDAAPIKKKPAWAKSVDWQEGFTLPRKRIRWNRFELAPGISLRYLPWALMRSCFDALSPDPTRTHNGRYRVWPKTEKVKPTEVERRAATTDSEAEAETSSKEETSDVEDTGGDGGGHVRKRSPARTERDLRRKRTRPAHGSETGEADEAEDSASVKTRKRKRGATPAAKKGWTALGHARSSQEDHDIDEDEDEADDDDEYEAKESEGESEQRGGRRNTRKRGKRSGSTSDHAEKAEVEETGGIASRTRSRSRTHALR